MAAKLKFEDGVSWTNLSDELHKLTGDRVDKDRIRGALRRHSGYKNKIKYEDKKPVPTENEVYAYYNALKHVNKTLDDMDTKQTKTTITIDDNQPVGIAFWGDWHIGARGTNYTQFDKDKELIQDTDGLYAIGMGDYKDNANAYVHASSVSESTTAPSVQDLLVKSFFSETADKWLAIIRGCHDDWDKKLTDKDFIALLAEETNSVNLWHGGGITVKLGSQQYKIRAKYLECKSWEQIAVDMGYSWRQIHYIHSDALKKIAHHCTS